MAVKSKQWYLFWSHTKQHSSKTQVQYHFYHSLFWSHTKQHSSKTSNAKKLHSGFVIALLILAKFSFSMTPKSYSNTLDNNHYLKYTAVSHTTYLAQGI